MAISSTRLSGRAVRLYIEMYSLGSDYHDRANNRSLHRLKMWLQKDDLAVYTYSLDPHGSRGTDASGPRGNEFSSWGKLTFDFRPSGTQRVITLASKDVWIRHDSSGSGTAIASGSVNGDTIGSASASVTYALADLYTVPSAPGKPTLSKIGSNQLTLTSTEGSNGGQSVTTRNIEYSTSSTFASGVKTLSVSSLSNQVVKGLTELTTYYFRTRVRNAQGWSSYSSTTSATTLDVPGDPTVAFGTRTATTMVVNFTDPTYKGGGITGRRIQYSLNEDFSGATTVTLSGTSTTLTGLKQGHRYYVRGQAQNSVGWGDYSDEISNVTLGAPLVVWVKIAGQWTRCSLVVKEGSTWRPMRVWVKDQGQWKDVSNA